MIRRRDHGRGDNAFLLAALVVAIVAFGAYWLLVQWLIFTP